MTGEAAATTPVETTATEQTQPEESTALTGDPATDDPSKGTEAGKDDPAKKEGEGGDDKTGEGNPDGSYTDFQVPEGMGVDKALLERATPLFKELNLTQEGAQKLVSLYAEHQAAGAQSQVDQFNQMREDWLTEAKSDKEIGGDKFDENVADARVALNKFGTPELKTLLNKFGIGNNAEVIRFMARIGKLTKEDDPGSAGGNRTEKQDRVTVLYPNETK